MIPAYNAEDWIAETVQSALAQTWPRKEIIVVDDGSTDRTLDIARRFASKKVEVLTQGQQGAAAARNKAFSVCQGEYIQWLDADDQLASDKIFRQLAALDLGSTKRTLVSAAWAYFNYRIRNATFNPTALWCDLSPVDWLVKKMGQNLHMQTATWLTSRELADAAGPWDTQLLGDDDGEYFCRVLLQCDGVRFVPEAKVYYRVTGFNRLSHIGHSDKKKEAQFASMKLHIRYIRSLEESARVHSACLRYLQTWLVYFYPERPDIVEEAQQLANELGGTLKSPQLPWKYHWLQKLFGWGPAKRAQILLPGFRASVSRSCDKLLYLFGV